MAFQENRISDMILEQLGIGERRVLALTVTIRTLLDRAEGAKGDLSAKIKSALRKLVTSGRVVDADGMYSLAPR